MKKFAALAVAILMAFALVACGGGGSSSAPSTAPSGSSTAPSSGGGTTSDITVGVVLKTLSSEYWNYVKAGAEQAAIDLGVNVVVVGPNAESDIEPQVAMIEEQLGQDISAIVVAPNDSSAAANALAPAVGKIPVLFVDTDAELEGKTAFVGTSNEDAAAIGGAYVAEKLGAGAKAVIIYGQEGENTSNARTAGYKKALEAGGVEILAEQSGNNTTDGAMKTMEDLLNRFPDEIDAVLCMNDDTAIGAYQACKQANIDDIMIIGFDGNVSAVEAILRGEIEGTVAQQPYMMGYIAVEKAVAAANGETIDAIVPVDAKLVTAENAQAHLDELASYLA